MRYKDYVTTEERLNLSKNEISFLSKQALVGEQRRLDEIYFHQNKLDKQIKIIQKNMKILYKKIIW